MCYPEYEELFNPYKRYKLPIDIDELLPDKFFDWEKIGIKQEEENAASKFQF